MLRKIAVSTTAANLYTYQPQILHSTMTSMTNKDDKLSQLKAKIQKDKQIMKKSGKRFKESISAQIDNGPKNNVQLNQLKTSKDDADLKSEQKSQEFEKIQMKKDKKFTEIQISEENTNKQIKTIANTSQIVKQSINLTELSLEDENSTNITVSKLFEKELLIQKSIQISYLIERNNEILVFMKALGLEQYVEELIHMGYDEMETLIQIKVEEMNHLMMRAYQQDILLNALKKYRKQKGIQEQTSIQNASLVDKPMFFKTKIKMHSPKKHDKERRSPSKLNFDLFRPKSAMTTNPSSSPTNSRMQSSSLFSSNSFLYSVGPSEWCVDAVTRRACSNCFKIALGSELIKRKQCFYCKQCNIEEDDPLEIMMSSSMVRSYTNL